MGDRQIEKWSKGKQANTGKEHIAIYKGNQLAIPSAVYDRHLSGTEAVKLQYSTNTDEIGIEPSEPDDRNAYKLGSGTKTVNCKSFLITYNLTVEETTKHPIEVESGMIWVDTTEII